MIDKIPNSLSQTRKNFVDLVNANAWQWRKPKTKKPYPVFFITLTFEENVQDLTYANKEFLKWVKKFNYAVFKKKGASLCYLAVPQFQKRGAVHYHILFFNIPYLKGGMYDIIERTWTHGTFWNVEKVNPRTIEKTINYLARYMFKNFFDERLLGRRRYMASRNIKRPIVIRDDIEIEKFLIKTRLGGNLYSHVGFVNDFTVFTEFVGVLDVKEIYFKNQIDLTKYL